MDDRYYVSIERFMKEANKTFSDSVKFEEHTLDGVKSVLRCPSCGGGNLHHDGVNIYFRKEDEGKTTVKSIGIPDCTFTHQEEMFSTDRNDFNNKNPSLRRNGIRILFNCEHCYDHVELCIAQHKGLTLMHMEYKAFGRKRMEETGD